MAGRRRLLRRPDGVVGPRLLRTRGLPQRVQQRAGLATQLDLARHDRLLRRRRCRRRRRGAGDRTTRRADRDRRRWARRWSGARCARPGRAAVAVVRRVLGVRCGLGGGRAGAGDDGRHPMVPRPSIGGAVGRVDRSVGRGDPADPPGEAAARRSGPRRGDAVARCDLRRRHRAGGLVHRPARPGGRGLGARRCAASGRGGAAGARRRRILRGDPFPVLRGRHDRLRARVRGPGRWHPAIGETRGGPHRSRNRPIRDHGGRGDVDHRSADRWACGAVRADDPTRRRARRWSRRRRSW